MIPTSLPSICAIFLFSYCGTIVPFSCASSFGSQISRSNLIRLPMARFHLMPIFILLIVGTWSISFSMVVGSPGSGFILRFDDPASLEQSLGPTGYDTTIISRSSDYSCSVIQESSIDVDSVRLTTPVSQGKANRYHLGKGLCWNFTIHFSFSSHA